MTKREFSSLMAAWSWGHHDLWEAFGSIDVLASALRAVAPPLALDGPLQVWRGVIVPPDENPAGDASGLSWSTDYEVACWFAIGAPMRDLMEQDGGRPFVFSLLASAEQIISLHHGGTVMTTSEDEVLLEPAKLDRLRHQITIAGTSLTVADLSPDTRVPEPIIAGWRAAAAAYEARRYSRRRIDE
jgi:hypothetical protein